MKELSIEEKAKRYDDLLVKLQEAKVDNNVCDDRYCCVIEDIVPELAEYEDERIRKTLIAVVNLYYGEGEDEEKTACLYWLEKQKKEEPSIADIVDEHFWEMLGDEKQGEHKPTAEEVLIKAGLKPYKDGNQWCVLLGDNIQEGICGFGNTIEDALYAFLKDLIASQGEQKLNGTFVNVDDVREDFVQEVYRVLDADSTNDRANQIVDAFDNLPTVAIEKQGKQNGCSGEVNDEALEKQLQIWFEKGKSQGKDEVIYHPENFGLQKSAEWSEEDENLLKLSIENLTELKDRFGEEYGKVGDCIVLLESIKDRIQHYTSWKPSEEQMVALDGICSYIRNKADWEISQDMVSDLYKLSEQLKKLKD